MNGHTHTCMPRTQREWDSYSSGRSPWELNPVRQVHSDGKILIFHFTGTNPKADWPAKKIPAPQPHNNGVQPHSSDTAGSGDTTSGGWRPPFHCPPLTRQEVPEGKQSPSPCALLAEEWICGNISIPSMFPLCRGRMLHTELHCVLPASSQTQGLLGNLCVIKHESAISISPEALLVYWPSAICSYTLAK